MESFFLNGKACGNTQRKAYAIQRSSWKEKLITEQGENCTLSFLHISVSMCLCKLILYSCRDICLPVFVRVHIIVCGSPYSSFYATLNKSCYTHQKRIQHPLPSLSPVNSGIVAQGFEKGRPQERRMWDESDSYAHKNTQACTPRKEMCVGSDQQCVSTKKNPYILGQKVSSKRVKNKHRVINTNESCQWLHAACWSYGKRRFF